MRAAVLAVGLAAWAGAARAEVVDRSPAGFTTQHTIEIDAPAAKVWPILLKPDLWWNSAHSWSGDARNLTIDLERGCFCEALPGGGFARHMTVVYAAAPTDLRLSGALGPLVFTGASGNMTIMLKAAGARTTLVLTYAVGGYAKGGLADTWAGPVDGVLGEQLGGLKRAAEVR